MWNKIKHLIFSNFLLKILALVAATVLWVLILNLNDPPKSKTFTAKVDVLNENVLTRNGQYYEVANGDSTIAFRVSGKRSIIEKLSNSDFTATADLNYINNNNEVPVDLEISRYSSLVTMPTRTYYLKLNIGDLMQKRFSIKAATSGKPATGTVIGDMSVSPNVLTVSGPEEIVSTIHSVKAVCDVSGISMDITDSVVPTFFNKNGDEINTSKLTVNVTTVSMKIEVASSKSVPIEVTHTGSLAEGLQLDGIETDPKEIDVKGEASVLNTLTKIVIPDNIIDLSKITSDMETTVDITSYLPEGVLLTDDSHNQVKIKVRVNEATAKTFNVPTANLTIEGLGNDKSAEFKESHVLITMSGPPDKIEVLNAETITGSVDVVGLNEGPHQVTIKLNLEDGYKYENKATEIIIKAKK